MSVLSRRRWSNERIQQYLSDKYAQIPLGLERGSKCIRAQYF